MHMHGTEKVRVVLGAWLAPEIRDARPLAGQDPAVRWVVAVAFSLANEPPHPDKGLLRGGAAALATAARVDVAIAQRALDWMVNAVGWGVPLSDDGTYAIQPVRARVRSARRPGEAPQNVIDARAPSLGTVHSGESGIAADSSEPLPVEPKPVEPKPEDPRLQAVWDFMAAGVPSA